jgi:SPX domain protein involved in polyphosphate accumulation
MRVIRHELKCYINRKDYAKLSSFLKASMIEDKHNTKEGGYFIRSLYFDDHCDKAFYEKMAGIEKRKKFRLRIYGMNDQKVKFEIKNKWNNNILKETALISRADAKKVIGGDNEVLLKYNNSILNKIFYTFTNNIYRPVVMVDYTREAYVLPFNNIRITFDRFLSKNSVEFDLFDRNLPTWPSTDRKKIIMEVKYNHFLPGWIKKMIRSISFNRCAISKYCLSRIGD